MTSMSEQQPSSGKKKRRTLPSLPQKHSNSYSVSEGEFQSDQDIQFDTEQLSKLAPEILAQLKAVENDRTLIPGQLYEDIRATGSAKTGSKSTITMKSGKKLDVSLVEGSFRRIAGMREQADSSGSFVIRTVEIQRNPGKSLGFYIRLGDGWQRGDGVFVSRVNLGSLVETNGLLSVGDEILKVNNVDVTQMPLRDVATIMQYVRKLVLTVKVLTSVSLSHTWSLRRHPSRTSFIQRQREAQEAKHKKDTKELSLSEVSAMEMHVNQSHTPDAPILEMGHFTPSPGDTSTPYQPHKSIPLPPHFSLDTADTEMLNQSPESNLFPQIQFDASDEKPDRSKESPSPPLTQLEMPDQLDENVSSPLQIQLDIPDAKPDQPDESPPSPPHIHTSNGKPGQPKEIAPQIVLDIPGPDPDTEGTDHPHEKTNTGGSSRPTPNFLLTQAAGSASLSLPKMERVWISNESLLTNQSSEAETGSLDLEEDAEEATFVESPSDTLDPPDPAKVYSGLLIATLHSLRLLSPSEGDDPITCTISVNSIPTVHLEIPATPNASSIECDETFHLDLLENTQLTIILDRSDLTATKSIYLVHMFPDENEISSWNVLRSFDPIGRLKATMKYQPMTTAIPRIGRENPTSAELKDFVDANPTNSGLPLIVERSTQIIEQHGGLEAPGIYQMCASEASKDEALSVCLSRTKSREEISETVGRISNHAFAGVLKDFFRNLPEPFFTNDFSPSLIEAASMENASAVMPSFVECLPEEVLETLHFLLTHFQKVCDHSSANNMTTDKLARIFGPLMLTSASIDSNKTDPFASDFVSQANVFKVLMSQHKPPGPSS